MTIEAILGDDFTTPVLVKRSRSYDSSGLVVTEVWNTSDGGSWAVGSEHGTYTGLYLSTFNVEELPGKQVTTLVYKKKTWSGLSGRVVSIVGTSTKSADSNAMEIPIEQHPDYETSWATSKQGVTSYISPQPTYTYETVDDSFVWSEENIKSTAGQIIAPTGMTSPTPGKWLHVVRAIYEQGDSYLIRDTFQYAEKAWDTDIYEFVS